MSIFISGSLAYDRIMNFSDRFKNHILPDKIHVLNVSFLLSSIKESFGGTAGNIAYNLTLLGEQPIIIGCAGRYFDRYADWLKTNQISTDQIKIIPDQLTAGAYIMTDLDDNQITGFHPGAMSSIADQPKIDNADTSLAILAPGNIE